MLTLSDLSKHYDGPAGRLVILDRISLEVAPGASAAIMGPSGCGKSTLLSIIGALEPPSSGKVTLEGVDPYGLPPREVAQYRNENVGFVFQDHCLLPQLDVLENVLTPVLVGKPDPGARERGSRLLERVGLASRLGHKPSELSGGEKQRVALARALIRNPPLLLCDEPTGNLDHRTAIDIARLLTDLQAENRTILIVVTHSTEIAAHFGRRFTLQDGNLCALPA